MIKCTLQKCLNQTRWWSHLSHHRFKMLLFQAKKVLRINNAQVCRGLFINGNLTSLNYSLFKMLNSIKKRRSENNLAIFEVVYTYQGKVFVKEERTRGNEGTTHITTNSCIHQFLHRPDSSEQWSSTASQVPEVWWPTHLYCCLLSQRQIPPSKGRMSLCPPPPPPHITWTIPRAFFVISI